MNTKEQSWNWRLWLTSLIATSGIWTYFGSSAFAQNAGTLTVDPSNLIILDGNSTFISPSPEASAGNITINPGAVISTTTRGSGNGGNISINARSITIARTVPEPHGALGLLTFAVFGVASIYKVKQKSSPLNIEGKLRSKALC